METPNNEYIHSFNIQTTDAEWFSLPVKRLGYVTVDPRTNDLYDVLRIIGSILFNEIKRSFIYVTERLADRGDESLYDHAWKFNAELIDDGKALPHLQFSGEDAVIRSERWKGLMKDIKSWLMPNEFYIISNDEKEMWKEVSTPIGSKDYYAFKPKIEINLGITSTKYDYYNVPVLHRRGFTITCKNSDFGLVLRHVECNRNEDAIIIADLLRKKINVHLDDGLYKNFRHGSITKILQADHNDWSIKVNGNELIVEGKDSCFAKISKNDLKFLLDELL